MIIMNELPREDEHAPAKHSAQAGGRRQGRQWQQPYSRTKPCTAPVLLSCLSVRVPEALELLDIAKRWKQTLGNDHTSKFLLLKISEQIHYPKYSLQTEMITHQSFGNTGKPFASHIYSLFHWKNQEISDSKSAVSDILNKLLYLPARPRPR